MTYTRDCTWPEEYLEQLNEEGLESLPEMIQLLVIQATLIKRGKRLNAKPYECRAGCKGHVDGCKPNSVKTRVIVPKCAKAVFKPRSQEKGIVANIYIDVRLGGIHAHSGGHHRGIVRHVGQAPARSVVRSLPNWIIKQEMGVPRSGKPPNLHN